MCLAHAVLIPLLITVTGDSTVMAVVCINLNLIRTCGTILTEIMLSKKKGGKQKLGSFILLWVNLSNLFYLPSVSIKVPLKCNFPFSLFFSDPLLPNVIVHKSFTYIFLILFSYFSNNLVIISEPNIGRCSSSNITSSLTPS